jgi:hypothetical protein
MLPLSIFLLFCLLAVSMHSVCGSKISIDLNRHEKASPVHGAPSGKAKSSMSMTNSETGIKVVGKGHSITSSIHADNTQHIEHVPLETKYYRKGEIVLEHLQKQ